MIASPAKIQIIDFPGSFLHLKYFVISTTDFGFFLLNYQLGAAIFLCSHSTLMCSLMILESLPYLKAKSGIVEEGCRKA